ncbi:MAG: 50S ribosomal protein L18 [Candidatus Nomurabacteria bacterium]|jgi:large subunit ribosomal protein L18|nr:50S ribosomal protein L18 [Candidatus Nomurabacteria bacterium]
MGEIARKSHNKVQRKNRVRAKVFGTAERPRMSVKISNLHINVQIIDDTKHHTLASATTVGKKLTGTKTEKAAAIGKDIAAAAKKAKVKAVVLDRNSRKYAGRLAALADTARKEGLEF